ncbi:hypothetical protein [Streptomyces sp. S186]|uniref:hypothetical protein n=1 Tax=Streptomyces sp. S186 TaxID=3434395 RepID=UPI003F66884F
MTPRRPPRPDPEHLHHPERLPDTGHGHDPGRLHEPAQIHNDATAHGDHSIAAGTIRNVFIRWALHPSARWLPLLLACAALVVAGTTWPDGPASQYVLWGTLVAVSVGAATARVLVQRPRGARIVAALSLASLLATVGGWLAFRDVVAHGEIDATGKITTAARDLPDGARFTLTLAVAPGEARDALRLTLAIDDHDPAAPACRPVTAVALTAPPPGHAATPDSVHDGGTFDIPLDPQARTVRIGLTLHTDRGCRMDVRTTGATLHDT